VADGKQNKLKNSGEAAEDKSSSKSPDGGKQTCPMEKGWIEIELVGEDDKGIPNEPYRIVLPDGTERKGKTDARGLARVEGIKEGTCKVSPDLDAKSWEKAEKKGDALEKKGDALG
jgi:hypothetical protein